MSVSYWQDHSADETLECDVAVVGAGSVGAYTAWCLRQSGQNVALVEARHVAAGATGRNAGMVLTGLAAYYHEAIARYGQAAAREIWDLTLANRRQMFELAGRFGVYHEAPGSYLLALDDKEAAEVERAAGALAAAGLAGEFTRHDPTGRGFAAAYYQPGDGVIHPVALTEALVAHSGVPLLDNSEVFALEAAPPGMIVRSRRATIRCRQVALCTNAYAPLLHSYFSDKVTPVRGQVFVTEPLAAPLFPCPGYADYGFEYFRQLPDGRFLLGGWRQHFVDTEVGYEDRVTPGIQAGLEQFAARYWPELAGVAITHRWSGTMGFSRDHIPLVGLLPDVPAVGFAVGFTGHGNGWGLKTAERLVDLLLHGTDPGVLNARRLD